ncbi:hypothetical protein RIF29_08152 [Crotalaria pallida]|uniref:Uncharacterized protein n=1 Tax=Crotalaria pallida TaxID=3830 RepID=A0AAN9J7V6_CROPI
MCSQSGRFSKWRRMVRQQRGKLYIMRVCISMLLNWHKFPKPQLILRRCSRHFREQKTRFYIIWRCIVILIGWEERF